MKKRKNFVFILCSILAVSCGMKSITQEQASEIYEEIIEEINSTGRESQNEISANVIMTTSEPNYKFSIRTSISHNARKETYHSFGNVYKEVAKEIVEAEYETWSWKEGNRYYYATCEGSENHKELHWCYTNELRTNNNGLYDFLDFSLNLAEQNESLKEESIKARFGENANVSFKSKGKGSLIQEIHGETENGVSEEKISFENYLLTEYSTKFGNTTNKYEFNWGQSTFKKPNIENFQYAESI